MEKMPLVKPSRCEHNNIAGYCHFCEELAALREENARLKAVYQDACNAIATLTREREDARAEVAACDGHAYLRDEIKRLEGLILKVWEQSESDDDALCQLGPEACRIRGEAK